MSEQEEMLLGGKHSVQEALKSGRQIHKIWMSENAVKGLHPIQEQARKAGIPIQLVDRRKLDQLVPDMQHQGIVAQITAVPYVDVDEILAKAEEEGVAPFLIILDEIEDPHNLGSILRTCDCAGAHGVIIPKRRAVGLTPIVSKTSAGAVEYVPVARVTNLVQTVEMLKKKGIWIAGTDVAARQELYETDLRVPLAIVIGNEHKGISRLLKEKCDWLMTLPMFGQINSLNASVAAGIIMYEVVRQRRR